MVTSTGTFVSCKDYDDDIDEINGKIDKIETTLSELESKIGDKGVSSVTFDEKTGVLTVVDGTGTKTYTIKMAAPEVDEVIRSLHRSSSEYPNQVYPEQSATRSFYLLRTEKAITFDDILPIIREALEKGISHIVIYSVSKPEPEAESAVRTVGTAAVEFRLLETIPQIRERFLPDDAEIDSEIKAAFPPAERVSVRVRAERAASKLRTEKHASKYFFAGMGLYALSFFSAYRFYMRLAASAMMFAAMLLFIRKITASSKPADSRR